MLIDSHCHLDYFTTELDAVLARAAAAGVGELVTIGTTMDQSRAIRNPGRSAPGVVVYRRRPPPKRRPGSRPDAGADRGAGGPPQGHRHR